MASHRTFPPIGPFKIIYRILYHNTYSDKLSQPL